MTSPVLAGPISDCCVQSVKHEGQALGKTIEIAGVSTYLSEPSTQTQRGVKKVVLFFPDVFGPFYLNNQLTQDYFASQGFHVLGIDYFFGDPVYIHTEADFDRQTWVEKSIRQAKETVPKWIDAVLQLYGSEAKYSAVGEQTTFFLKWKINVMDSDIGYCFGGPYALAAAERDQIVSVAFAHPSRLTEDHFKTLTKPLLIAAAEIDNAFPAASRRRAIDILTEKKATFHLQLFSGVVHGFATKGDPNIENSRWAKEEAARSIINWFIRFSK
ncbi:hypothetical protein MD484_g8011, partial [Candolleomyces efflorescens]